MRKIVTEEKVEVWIKKTRLIPEDLTDKQIGYISETGNLDKYECEDIEVLFETEELIPQIKNNGFHTVKIYDEKKNTIYINGVE